MSILDDNLAVLGRRFPSLAERVASAPDEADFSAFAARSGQLTASLGEAALHSRYDPAAEARKAAASLPQGSDLCLLEGFGLGWMAEALLAADPEILVLVMEKEASALRSALSSRGLGGLLADERLSFAVGAPPEGIVHALDGLGCSHPLIIRNSARTARDPSYWAACDEALRRWEAKRGINDATLKRFGHLWIRNLGRNLGRIGEHPGIRALEGAFTGMPALVAAAGPSLDAVLPRMGDIAQRCLVIAVDTSARLLQAAGVDPDFVVVADPQYWNTRHLDRFDARRSFLVAEAAVHPRALCPPWRSIFLSASIFPLARFVEERSGERGRLGAGGSVATTAWDLARYLGAAPLWLAGLDLSFPGLATHASGSFFEERALRSSTRLRSAETDSFLAAHSAEPFLAPDASGSTVLTDRRMILYAWWFESRIASSGIPCKSLSPRGLAVGGLPLGAVEEILSLPLVRPVLDGRLASLEGQAGPKAAFEAARRDLLAELERIALSSERALRASREALKKLERGQAPAREMESLERADAALLGSDARDIVSFLFPSMEEMFQKKAERMEDALENGVAVYAEIEKQARFHLDILEGRRR